MALVVTPWSYSVECDGDALPPIVSVEGFRLLAPGLSSTDSQVEMALDAVSAAVRDWCGWHVAPVLDCEWVGDGDGSIAYLPSMGVRSVSALAADGSPYDVSSYEWRESGLVRLKHGAFPLGWRSVACSYRAGMESPALGQIVAQIASNALCAAPGVAEEHAGSVGVTYNRTGDGITGGVSLLSRDKEALAPYRLARAW